MPHITVNKVKYTYSEQQAKVAEENGITANTIHNRIRLGWTIDDALSVPIGMSKEEYKTYIKLQKKQRLCTEPQKLYFGLVYNFKGLFPILCRRQAF
ncbi:hypothetical protein DOS66_03645 [Staphylococcus felis]|nr:hypothetical protein DOS66_03645 [Staphylococcus felis]